jgi:hypothetical protein
VPAGENVRTGSDRVRIRDRSVEDQGGADRRLRAESSRLDKGTSERKSGIRSVEPRKQGSRIWSGGRTTPTGESKARPQQVQPNDRGQRSSAEKQPARVNPRSGSSGNDAGSTSKPRERSSSGSSRKSSGSVQPKKGSSGGSSSGSAGRSSGGVRSTSQPRSSAGSRSSAGRGSSSAGSSSSRGSSGSGGGSSRRSGGGRSSG